MTVNWRGIYPAVTTQFREDGTLNVDATQKVIAGLIEDGVHGLVMLGTVGENTSLRQEEKLAVVKAALEVSSGHVPVITGVAEYTTAQAVEYAKACEQAGLDALMALPAMVYKSDTRESVAHFRAVAGATALPIMIYNNPGSYGIDIKPPVVAELAETPNIVAVKESSEDPRRITDITNLCGDRLALMAGVDDVALECLLLGARGWVSGLANVFPAESVRLFEYAEKKQVDKALEIYRWMTPALHLDVHPKLVQMIKLAEQIAGRGTETVRPPRLPLEGAERQYVTDIIETALDSRPVI